MRMLLAGPGTGKTWRIKGLVDQEFGGSDRILVLSFTNATVSDLSESFADYNQVDCYTLHSFALKINHLAEFYVLDGTKEAPALKSLATTLDVSFDFLCRKLQCITFDAMIYECLGFLKHNPVYAQDQIGALDLLIVDEYQDFNAVDRELIDEIAKHAGETIVLGDDDQSIYGFKDADPDAIIELHGRLDVRKLAHDNKCYRCPDEVVDWATSLIRHNSNRVVKPWHQTGRAGNCSHRQFRTQADTNEHIVAEVERIQAEDDVGDSVTSILVLSPMRFYLDDLVVLMSARGIEVVDFWIQAIDSEDYRRVWWIRSILAHRRLLNLTFLSMGLTAHFKKKFRKVLGEALETGFDEESVIDAVEPMFDDTMTAFFKAPPGIPGLSGQVPEFAELLNRVDASDLSGSLDGLLRNANPSKEFAPGAVNVMSIHKSKGLQADVVFITGLVDGILPNTDDAVDTIEAQRRLLYVGVTRAQKSLQLLSTVEWDGRVVHRVDKSQFTYDYRSKKYKARTSKFVGEMR